MRRRLTGRALALALAVVLLPLSSARSTTVEELSAADLVARSELIVWGDVVSVRSGWDDRHTRIFTQVEVTSREGLKGPPGATGLVTLRLPGGEVDGLVSVIHGMPQFRQGEEVVLHLTERHPRSAVRLPVGLGQGVHRVLRPANGPVMAARDTRELHLVRPGVSGGQPGASSEVELETLLRSIRDEVARQGAGGPR
jgi:hypothetical protein